MQLSRGSVKRGVGSRPNEVRMSRAQQIVGEAVPSKRVIDAADNLDVRLRHRLRSIPGDITAFHGESTELVLVRRAPFA
jgi:hypothetical protein